MAPGQEVCPSLEGASWSADFRPAGPGWSLAVGSPRSDFFFFLLPTCCKPWNLALHWGPPFSRPACKSWDGNRWQRILSGSVWASLIDKTGRLAETHRKTPPSPSCPCALPIRAIYPVLAWPVRVRCACRASLYAPHHTMRAASATNHILQSGLSLSPAWRFNSSPPPSCSPTVFVLASPGLACFVLCSWTARI